MSWNNWLTVVHTHFLIWQNSLKYQVKQKWSDESLLAGNISVRGPLLQGSQAHCNSIILHRIILTSLLMAVVKLCVFWMRSSPFALFSRKFFSVSYTSVVKIVSTQSKVPRPPQIFKKKHTQKQNNK